jgi:hypothetical protein
MDNTVLLAILSSGALSAVVSSVVTYFIDKAKRKEEENDLLQFLTASQLTILGQNVIKDGSIDFETLKLYSNMYDRYKKIKGANGYVDALMTKVKSLPIKEN